jgi:hypothetical protein
MSAESSYEFKVIGALFEWRGPSPFHFVEVSEVDSKLIKSEANLLSYGWGVIPIYGRIGKIEFTTSLIPKAGRYLVPIKDAVRKSEQIEIADQIQIEFNLGKKLS